MEKFRKTTLIVTVQINSTRLITDDTGNVVFSEANGPFGDVQKTWSKAYDPKQKFSGKEREVYSDMDDFEGELK